MALIDNSGPAFPSPEVRGFDGMGIASQCYGMSLRDWFAGQALAAKTCPGLIGYEDHAPEHRALLIGRLVRDAWEIADAMLLARASCPSTAGEVVARG